MIEKKILIAFEYFPITNTFSIYKDTIIYEDDVVIGKNRNACGFSCDQLDEMINYIGDPAHPLISLAQYYWTPEVIQQYKDNLLKNEI